MGPVFIFGTGRCGSTHLQRLITVATECWMWGEHDGFLEPLLRSVRRSQTSSMLAHFAFPDSRRSDDQLISEMTAGLGSISWINRLDSRSICDGIRDLIENIFRSGLPKGWSEWGFKEILYGFGNDAPEILLGLFPSATAIFTFREPKNTIESMIKSWSPALLNSSPSIDQMQRTYRERANRWHAIVKYFLSCREKDTVPKIIFVSSDKLIRSNAEILRALGLPVTRLVEDHFKVTNPGPTEWPQWAGRAFAELFEADELQFLEMFTAARTISDADFGDVALA